MDAMNQEVLGYFGLKFEKREKYANDYVSELLNLYKKETNLDESTFVSGRGHRKSIRQKQSFQDRSRCHFHAAKMGLVDVKSYASDIECFVPLMEKFNELYGHCPNYPVADAGYGSYNNYLY